jgi:hypothetical protein
MLSRRSRPFPETGFRRLWWEYKWEFVATLVSLLFGLILVAITKLR